MSTDNGNECNGAIRADDTTNPKDLIGLLKAPLRLVPPALAIWVSQVMKLGAKKYGPYNWRDKKVRQTVYLEAIERHLLALRDGEDLDPESGKPHEAHIAACCAIVLDARANDCLIDDRYITHKRGAAARLLSEAVEKEKEETPPTPPAPQLPKMVWHDGVPCIRTGVVRLPKKGELYWDSSYGVALADEDFKHVKSEIVLPVSTSGNPNTSSGHFWYEGRTWVADGKRLPRIGDVYVTDKGRITRSDVNWKFFDRVILRPL